jgi:malonyl CoA-acyl carrier protein transacylase
LADNTTANAQLQGDDISTFDAVTPTVQLTNYTQISRKTVVISGTVEAVNKAGRKSELAYQLAKRAAELKRDMETIMLANQAASAGDSTTAQNQHRQGHERC